MQQLSALDASFLYADLPHAPSNATTIWIYDRSTAPGGALTFEQVLAHVGARVAGLPALHNKLARVPGEIDRPWWVDDPHFDLEYHVRELALPAPGNWHQFCTQVARLHERPLDQARSLWELYMIDGLDDIDGVPPGSFALVLKAHHAAIDGKAAMAIMAALHATEPDAEDEPVQVTRPDERQPSSWELLARGSVNATLQPVRTARRLARLAPGVTRVARLAPSARSTLAAVPTTRFNAPITAHRVIDTCFVELDALKTARKAVDGATVNDVALTIFGGALRTYLGEVGELPTAPLRAMTPVALRSTAGGGEIGNRLSAMVVSLASDVEDPLARLRAVTASTRAAKDGAEALGPSDMGEVLGFVPTAMIAPGARLASRMARFGLPGPVNTVVSNVAGSPEVLYLAGARLVRSTGGGPVVDGLGLINYMTSYAGTAAFGFTACREQMPDPERYTEAILRSFDALCASVKR